jgi:hypothetical protein
MMDRSEGKGNYSQTKEGNSLPPRLSAFACHKFSVFIATASTSTDLLRHAVCCFKSSVMFSIVMRDSKDDSGSSPSARLRPPRVLL